MASRRIAAVLGIMLFAAPGCTTERVTTNDGRPLPPEPRRPKAPPSTAVPNRMILVLGPTEDADGNGFPDLIPATVALFAEPHATSLEADGTFILTLWRQGEALRAGTTPLAEWRILTSEQTSAASWYGPCYQVRLNLFDAAESDVMQAMTGDLRGQFEFASGAEPISSSNELRPVRLGRRTGAVSVD
jgi:hypothetical protein